jgi:hypothetical protein
LLLSRRTAISRCQDGHQDEFHTFLSENDGSCKLEETFFAEGYDETGSGLKVERGRFKATCTLRGGTHDCGDVLCGGMVLTASGSIYEVEAYSTTQNNPVVPGSAECFDTPSPRLGGAQAAPKPASGTPTDSAASTAATIATATPSYNLRPPSTKQLFKGTAQIYSGPMTVTSLHRSFHYTSAWFEYVKLVTVPAGTVPITGDAPPGAVVVTPLTYSLVFARPASSNY